MTREEAIKELALIAQVTMWNERREAVEMAIEALQDRPTGKWIQPSGVLTVICSQCHHINNSSKWNFCPDCGAKMERKEDDEV